MTIQEIEAKVQEQLLTARENAQGVNYALDPYKPCPVCPGVLRPEGDKLKCWTCGAELRI